MSMTPPVGIPSIGYVPPYVPPYVPMNNMSGFTYQDGMTFLELFEQLRSYLTTDLVNFVNTNFATLGNEFAAQANLIIDTNNTALNAAVTSVASNSVTVQDAVIATAVDTTGTATRTALDNLYAPGIVSDPAVAAVVNDRGSAGSIALNTYYLQKSDTSLSTVYGVDATGAEAHVPFSPTAVNGALVQRDAAGRFTVPSPALDTDVSNKVYADTSATSAAAAATTSTALDAAISDLVASGTLTHPALITLADAEGASAAATAIAGLLTGGNAFRRYPTIAALPVTGMSAGVIAVVDNLPGAFFVYDSATTYKMYGVPKVASASARDAAITNPVQGMRVYQYDMAATLEYSALYDSASNIAGRNVAGWYIVGTNIFKFSSSAATCTSAANGLVMLNNTYHRLPYKQRILCQFVGAGSAGSSAASGVKYTVSTGGTLTLPDPTQILIGGSGVGISATQVVEIAAGVGADVNIALVVNGANSLTAFGQATFTTFVEGEF